jgi:REP element-mobilizing transposase RayT
MGLPGFVAGGNGLAMSKTPRLKVPGGQSTSFHHCISRVVDGRYIFEEAEAEQFLSLMRECERFCRVRVLTYCVMSNHFHLLVEVPQPPATLPGPEEILEDVKRLSGFQFPDTIRATFERLREAGDDAALAEYLATFHRRMYDVSAFMKTLKQRFSQWYNPHAGRRGTLWESGFKSVLVDGTGSALATMAAYIDLNPVRAGVVKDPKDYRWCGYAEAESGSRRARAGLQTVVTALNGGREESPARSLEIYRGHLHLDGDGSRGKAGRAAKGALGSDKAAKVLAENGELPVGEYLKCRVRYFCDGAVFGGREFVEGVFQENREVFGSKRKTGARRMRGLADTPLYTLRALRVGVFGKDKDKDKGKGKAKGKPSGK